MSLKRGSGAKPPKFYTIFLNFRRVSTESPLKYFHFSWEILIFQKFGRGQYRWGGGSSPPSPYGSYGPE